MAKIIKWITITEALKIVAAVGKPVTRPTIHSWVNDKERYPHLGKKVFGRYQVDRDALIFYLNEGGE